MPEALAGQRFWHVLWMHSLSFSQHTVPLWQIFTFLQQRWRFRQVEPGGQQFFSPGQQLKP